MKINLLNWLFASASLASLASAKNIIDGGLPWKKEDKPNKGRLVGQLGKLTSKGPAASDCAKGTDVQLFKGSPVLKFGPSMMSCRSGKSFAGSTIDGKNHVTLVRGRGDTFTASVTNDETGAVYSIGPDADGVMTVVERYQEDYGDELDPEDAMKPKERALFEAKMMEESNSRETSTPAAPFSTAGLRGKAVVNQLKDMGDRFLTESRDLQTLPLPESTIDVLVVWTDKAECRNSGLSEGCTRTATTESNIRARINLAIQETNTAYYESGVRAELNLVHAYRHPSYVEPSSNAFSTALSQIRSTTDGVMDDVHSKRQQYGADVVALIIDDPQYCGIAYLGPSKQNMFSVTAWNCATGYYSFGHEIGHNMGCNHDKGTSGACSSTNYNYGYRDPNTEFRSILAYNCGNNRCPGEGTGGCTRVQRFSNPNYTYNGAPIGTATVDNAKRINDVRVQISNYYASSGPVTPGPTPPPVPPTPPPTSAPSQAPTPCPGKTFRFDILTDNYPGETTWALENTCTNAQVASGGPYGSTGTSYTSGDICVGNGEFTFTINDSYGDGICCGYGIGSYSIFHDGTKVETTTTGAFASSESTTFGSCGPAPTPPPTTSKPTSSPSRKPTSAPSASPTLKPSSSPSNKPTTAAPQTSPPTTSKPTNSPSQNPTSAPSASPTSKPSSSPSNKPTTAAPQTAAPTTSKPTNSPSKTPTSAPSVSPTPKPSSSPSNKPTTAAPTTSTPTNSPSKNPTSAPSASPTPKPSSSPSNKPTTAAPQTSLPTTSKPTNSPSQKPTSAPSASPTPKPSSSPSNKPTTAAPVVAPPTPPTPQCTPRFGQCNNDPDNCCKRNGCFWIWCR